MSTGILVTGLGVVAPHGHDAASVFEAVARGESAVRELPMDLARPVAAATVDIDLTRWFNKLQSAGVDRVSQLAVAAADLAVQDAGGIGHAAPERIGIYVGCGMGGAAALDTAYRSTSGRVSPLTIPAFMPNAPAAHVAMRLGVRGPVLTYAVACASSSVAIAEAAKAVRCGEVDLAIAGGTESLIVPGVVLTWQAMQTLATFTAGGDAAMRCCRPFASDRSGFVLGEGAAFLVLESAGRAAARQAPKRHAELAGWGLSCDATHLTKPDAQGQQRALRAALQLSGLQPADIGYVNAHGTATKAGDAVECEAIRAVWGEALPGLRVSSTKALHGHLLGAAGALEAVITIQSLVRQQLPPQAHCDTQDPLCDVPLARAGEPLARPLEAALSSSFAFGGTNSSLVFKRA
ncbi:beta-ketoacyl-[acyl-carrier-protein] synthase family protein [Leptothrix discophora]|uniref:Nodulation protein E n=1 Tax=Leptothrix discophora TaxID=89 RepID=A0ABT9G8T6_LEPDI|nr:beta-ketoacyl-[acyl-carrier-protein] synthase family protein [Leptothrix discophora]MDP4302899.1 beta-ketoacyl-[acyl-carrier-protein] synthase family protein [Leptothrix discophora]